jgi:hypothetical protein
VEHITGDSGYSRGPGTVGCAFLASIMLLAWQGIVHQASWVVYFGHWAGDSGSAAFGYSMP